MLRISFGARYCPECHSPVTKERRGTDAGDIAVTGFSELYVWILIGGCALLGAWNWIAAAGSVLLLAVIILAYQRARSVYHCKQCSKVFTDSAVSDA